MYKIDHKNLREKIKNLEQRFDFKIYNIKEKHKEKEERKKLLKNKQTKEKKNTPTTIQRVYMVFALKKKKIVIIGYRSKNQRRNSRLNN